MTKRKYRGTDSQMLMAAYLIADRGIEKAPLLAERRPQWADPFFPNLKAKINEAFSKNMGVDILAYQQEATAKVKGIIATAHRGIMALKAEIEVGFRSSPTRRSVLLTELGYDKLPKKNISQSQYVQLLATLRANLTPAVKAELLEVGANPAAIDALLQLAQQLIEANDRQESLKTNRKILNAGNIAELNALYDEVTAVCKLVATYFAGNQTMKEHFSFAKALKAQGYMRRSKKKEPSASPTKPEAAAPNPQASSRGASIAPTLIDGAPSANVANEKAAAADE